MIITLIAGGAGGYFIYHRETPTYQSSVRMIVSGTGNGEVRDEVTARVLATQRAAALSQIAATAPAVKAAAARAGYPGDSPAVSSTSDEKGPFLNVNVTDTNARRAKAIADAYAAILPPTLVKLEGRTDTTVSVSNLAPASLPTEPVSPKLLNDLALGLAAGLILGIAIALLREVIDRTIRDTDELERITELTVLGTVPRDSLKSPLPADSHPRSARAEAYRQIRTTLLNSTEHLRTIAVTSASMGEGKTSVATNLAAVFSRAGHRVAIVDADLRRPRVAPVFEVPGKPGLSDVLAQRTSLADALVVRDDGRLAVLTAGAIPANPSEALGGTGMERVLAQLAADYEYVFVDTPPVLPVTDALVVAPMVDGVVLVTRLGRTTRERVRRAQTAVARVNASMIGVVPNYAGKGADRDYRYGYKYTGSHKKGEAPIEIDADLLQPAATHPVEPPTATTEAPQPAAPAQPAGPVAPVGVEPPPLPQAPANAMPAEPSRPTEPVRLPPPEPAYVAPSEPAYVAPPEPAYVAPPEAAVEPPVDQADVAPPRHADSAPPAHADVLPPEPAYEPPKQSSGPPPSHAYVPSAEPAHQQPGEQVPAAPSEPAYVPPREPDYVPPRIADYAPGYASAGPAEGLPAFVDSPPEPTYPPPNPTFAPPAAHAVPEDDAEVTQQFSRIEADLVQEQGLQSAEDLNRVRQNEQEELFLIDLLRQDGSTENGTAH